MPRASPEKLNLSRCQGALPQVSFWIFFCSAVTMFSKQPPTGWIRSQPWEEKFRKPHPGSSVHFKWWAMRSDYMDFCSAQISEKISRQKEHQRSQILWGWYFSCSSRNHPPALGGHPQKGWKCRKEVASRGLLSPGTRGGSPRLRHAVRVFLTGCGLLLNGNNIMDNNRNRWEYTGTPRWPLAHPMHRLCYHFRELCVFLLFGEARGIPAQHQPELLRTIHKHFTHLPKREENNTET